MIWWSVASRKYIDLIHKETTKFANWDPSKKIEVGDFGFVNPRTGEFEVEGNVYKHPDTIERAAQFPVIKAYPTLSYTVSSRTVSRMELALSPELGIQGLAEASIKGEWHFGDTRGALLAISHPRLESMPPELWKALRGAPYLENKSLVTEIHSCPAYCLFLSSGKKDRLRLALHVTTPIPDVPGLTAGGQVSGGWWKEHDAGVYQDAYHPTGLNMFVPLFRLKTIPRRHWYRDSPPPEPIDDDPWVDSPVPWGVLNEEGEAFVDRVFDWE